MESCFCMEPSFYLKPSKIFTQRVMKSWFSSYFGSSVTFYLQQPERYRNIYNRIIGQVWGSAASPSSTANAVSIAVFPNSSLLQAISRLGINLHETLMPSIWRHYDDAI